MKFTKEGYYRIVGKWMQKKRAERRLKLSDIASFLGCDESTVGKYEKGTRHISLYNFMRLKDYFAEN